MLYKTPDALRMALGFYPRIDWRGNAPGFTEMDFPIIPWVMAQLYRVFGVHEIIGRLLSYAFMLLALVVFSRIASTVLPDWPHLLRSSSLSSTTGWSKWRLLSKPESLMLLLYLMAVYFLSQLVRSPILDELYVRDRFSPVPS